MKNNKETISTYRATARFVGMMYIAMTVFGITGIMLIQSILGSADGLSAVASSSMLLAIGAALWLLTVIGDAAHGVLLFPILKPHHERIAIGYLAFRILDAVFIAVMVIFVLMQIPLASEFIKAQAPVTENLQALSLVFTKANLYAYHMGMLSLGIASLMLCYTLYRARLVPRFLAVWGFVGYVTILVGSLLEILGIPLQSLHTIPGGLWELFMGFWLIAKGFNASGFATLRNTTGSIPDAVSAAAD